MKLSITNVREGIIDGFFESRALAAMQRRTTELMIGLTLIMATFYLGFVAWAPETGSTVLGVVFGVLHLAIAVFGFVQLYRRAHPLPARSAIIAPPRPWPRASGR